MANTEAAAPSGHSGDGAIRPAWRSVRRATCNSETLRRGRSLPREYGAKSRLRPASASKLNAVHARTSRAMLKSQHALITWHGHDGRQDTSSMRAQTLMGSEAQARKLSRVLVNQLLQTANSWCWRRRGGAAMDTGPLDWVCYRCRSGPSCSTEFQTCNCCLSSNSRGCRPPPKKISDKSVCAQAAAPGWRHRARHCSWQAVEASSATRLTRHPA